MPHALAVRHELTCLRSDPTMSGDNGMYVGCRGRLHAENVHSSRDNANAPSRVLVTNSKHTSLWGLRGFTSRL